MTGDSLTGFGVTADTRELLTRVGLIDSDGKPHRSSPLSDPPAFGELVSRLASFIDAAYDILVVRDLFGDRVLGYQLSLISGKPVAISYDREGIIVLEDRTTIEHEGTALIVADTHFTTQSIQAAASCIEQSGMQVAGAAMLLQIVQGNYSFPIWSLEHLS